MAAKKDNTLKIVALVAAAGLGVYFFVKNYGSSNTYQRTGNYQGGGSTSQGGGSTSQGGGSTNDFQGIEDKWTSLFEKWEKYKEDNQKGGQA